MSLEISFVPNPSSRPQRLNLQDGESLQVFSGESFQIQNPEIVAQLVPQDKDLQIVCHDGTSFILKNFLEVDFAQEPQVQLQEGTAITWHDFVQQTDGIDQAFNLNDHNNPTLAFAPLLVIAATSESQKWDFVKILPNEEEHAEAVAQELATAQTNPKAPNENEAAEEDFSVTATAQNVDTSASANHPSELGSAQANAITETTATSGTPNSIEIDIRKFLDTSDDGTSPPPVITATILGDDGIEVPIDDDTGIVSLPTDIFDNGNQVNIQITIDDGTGTTNTTITITETKDGGGETFHLLLSQNRVAENDDGALIGKLDTDDAGSGHTYEYTLSGDTSDLFEIVGNVLKLKDGVSIDYEAHPESYPIRVVATDETGHHIEQSIDVWPEDVNEIASISSIDTTTFEDVLVRFDPDDFDTAFQDQDSDYLEMVRIDTLPENGTLNLGGDPVIVGQLIDYEQIEELEFQPNANWNGDTAFQWSGFDGQAWSAESSPVSISIEAVNDAPVVSVSIGQQHTGADEAFVMDLPEGAFIDVDVGDTLAYSADLPSWLSIDSQTGAISGTPSNDHIGAQEITITATDSGGESVSQTFRILVESPNKAPAFTPISDIQTDEDTAPTLDLSTDFPEQDSGDELPDSATQENSGNTPGEVPFDLETEQSSDIPQGEGVGESPINATVSDGETSVNKPSSISTENANDEPVGTVSTENQKVPEDTTLNIDTPTHVDDIDTGDILSFTPVIENGDPLPDSPSVHPNNGQHSGASQNDNAGEPSITFTGSDELDASPITDSDAVDNAVAPPAISSNTDNQTTDEDTSFDIGVSEKPDNQDIGNELSYTSTLQNGDPLPEWLSVDPESGQLSGTPKNEDVGSFIVTVKLSNGEESTSDTLSITVNDANEFDVSEISDTDATTDAVSESAANGDSVGIAAFASDADASDNDVSYSLSDDASGRFAIDQDTGEITVADASKLDFETDASHAVEVLATSQDGSTSAQSYSIAVTDSDEFDVSPIDDSDAADNAIDEDATEGAAVGIVANASDDDGSSSEVSYSVDDARFSVDEQGAVRVANGATFDAETEETVEITVTATSEDGSTSDRSFSISVNDANEFDVSAISDTDATTDAVSESAANGDSVGIAAFASDNDATDSNVAYSLSEDADGAFAIDPSTGQVTVADASKLDFEDSESKTIEVTATSQDGSVSTRSFDIAIGDDNEGPVILSAISDQTTTEDSSFSIDASTHFDDQDLGDTLSYSASLESGDPLPSWLSIDSATGELSGTPENTDVGSVSISITASDGETSVSDTFSITVENTNDGPVAIADTNSIAEDDTSITGNILGNDSDEDAGDSLSVSRVTDGSVGSETSGAYGNITINSDGTYSYSLDNSSSEVQTLDDGDTLTETFTYTVSDAVGSTDTSTLSITINGSTDGLSLQALPEPEGDDNANQNITGGNGAETIVTGDGDDLIDGGNGADHITSNAGDDTIYGGAGQDTIYAGSGNDIIDGGVAKDIIDAGDGDDKIYATEGKDIIDAGNGDDTFIIDDEKNFGTLDGESGYDTLQLDGSGMDLDFSKINSDITNIEAIDIDGSGSNTLSISSEDVLEITDGERTLFIEGGADDHVEISEDFVRQDVESDADPNYDHYYDAGTQSHLYINDSITDLGTF